MRVKLIHVASRKEKVLELPERNGVVFGRNNLEDALINCGDTVPEPGNHHIEGNLQYVSRGQCTFYLKGNENPVIVDGYLINEEGKEISYRSKNGTYLNGVLVPGQGEIIRNGDVLRFGSEEMGDSFGFEIIVERHYRRPADIPGI